MKERKKGAALEVTNRQSRGLRAVTICTLALPGTADMESNKGDSSSRIECGECTAVKMSELHTDVGLRGNIRSRMGLEADPDAISGAEEDSVDCGATETTLTPTLRGLRSVNGKRGQNYNRARRRREALERRALTADGPANEVANGP
jgi:hypothetical protein